MDDPQELLWRLRAHYGLANTIGQPIVCIGGPSGWATPNAPELARERFQLDMKTVTIPEISALVEAGHWMTTKGIIRDTPVLDTCRAQVELELEADPKELVRSLRGFHCMLAYGDYTKEIEYAANKVGIKVQVLTA